MTPACRRCPAPTMSVVTQERAMGPEGEFIDVRVALCQPCRAQASRENDAAKSRRAVR